MRATPFMLLCSALALAACSKEKNTAADKDIVGQWHTVAFRSQLSSSLTWNNFSGVRITFVFNANKDFSVDGEAPARPDGKWALLQSERDVYLLRTSTGDTTHEFFVTFPHRDTMIMSTKAQRIVQPMTDLKLSRE